VLPVIALVGRPNVGKSTLFNVLTGTRDAIVADVPGVTRDRQYGFGRVGPMPYVAIDTGGLVENPTGIETQMRVQTERAIEEADRFVFIVDARAGMTHQDQFVARELRRAGKPVFLAVNKSESLDTEVVAAEFHALALGDLYCISATHGQGTLELMEAVLAGLEPVEAEDPSKSSAIRIAVIGRPNVGKSTLVNRLLGQERVITSEVAGTTRDSILVPFHRDDHDFLLIDTAGVRRRSKVEDVIERVSVAKTLQAIDHAHVVILVVDAHEQVGEQDASVLGLALQRGRAVILAVNKWDHIPTDQRDEIRRQVELKLDFVPFAPVHFISARHGTGVGVLVGDVIHAYEAAMRDMRTSELSRVLENAMTAHQPPLVHGRRIKLRYAHQGGKNPPRIVIHGNQTEHVPDAYSRYLSNVFRKNFDLFATPVSVEFRSEKNPFTERLREKRNSSGRPGKATAKNPGSKNQRETDEHARKKRKKKKRETERTTSAGKSGKSTSPGRGGSARRGSSARGGSSVQTRKGPPARR
jgi:GTP-binding protein